MCDSRAHAGADVQTQDIQPQPQRLPQDLPLPEMAEDGGPTRWESNTHRYRHIQPHEPTVNVSVTFSLRPFSAAEPSRQAPNKRRKRKMSGGSTISGGGGTNNNNNNKKKSPGSGFPLSSQVPVSTSLLSSVGTQLLHIQQKHYH